MRLFSALLALLLVASPLSAGAGAAWAGQGAPAACAPAVAAPEPAEGLAASFADDGSLVLSDGSRLVPAGIALPSRLHPDGDLLARAASAAGAALDGRFVALGATGIDRHGRKIGDGRLFATTGESAAATLSGSLVLALLEAGAGYADPRAAPACADALLAAEAVARHARRGIFASQGAIVSAADEAGMGVRAGLFAVAQGRVRAAGATRQNVFLNFGPRWREDFTAILAPKDFATILGDDLDPAMLRGTLVEVRGVVREEGGPAIFVRTAGEIAVLGGSGPRSGPAFETLGEGKGGEK